MEKYEGIFDTHAHYLKRDFGEELCEVLAELPRGGVELVMAIGCAEDEWEETKELCENYPWIKAALGIHPEYIEKLTKGWEKRLEEKLENKNIYAVGECGLDYHYENAAQKEVQEEVFIKQIEIAKRLDLPIIIHSRDACEDTMKILREYKPRGVMHCFSYSAEIAREVVSLGMYIGFTGVLTFKNAKKAAAACEAVPRDRLLLETDCPYMAPEPHRGERCDSTMIKYTAAKMAEIKGVSAEEMIKTANKNGRELFGID